MSVTRGFSRGVVALAQVRNSMHYPQINEVRAYWEGLRCGQTVPLRADVDPRGIEGALEHAFILERIAPRIARFRVAGAHLNDLMGMEVRGMPLTSIFAPATRVEMAPLIEQVFLTPAVAEFDLRGEPGAGRPALVGSLVILPLRSDLGDVSRALGCLVTRGPIGHAPRRFDVTGRRLVPLGHDMAMPAASYPIDRQPGLAEAPEPFAARPAGARSVPHLRLVKSD